MKKIIITIFSLFIFYNVISQNQYKQDTIDMKNKINFNFTTGAYSNVSEYGNVLGTYFSPQISISQNKKFSYGGGAIISYSNYSNFKLYDFNENRIRTSNFNVSQGLIYVNANYKPTEKISINAMAYKSFVINENNNEQNYINAFNNNMQGFYMNIDYKIAKNTHLNFGFNYSDGNNLNNNPFNNRNNYFFNNNNSFYNW